MEIKEKQDIPNFDAIIVAAGSGTRFSTASDGKKNNDTALPKQFWKILDKPIYHWSMQTFLSMPQCQKIICVIHPDYADLYKKLDDKVTFVNGGETRSLSVKYGLDALARASETSDTSSLVAIHDAARPFFSPKDTQNALFNAQTYGASTLAIPVFDTLRKADNKKITNTIDRDGIWSIQTPQIFDLKVIQKAYEKIDAFEYFTDETQLVSKAGFDIVVTQGSRQNVKITTFDDLEYATNMALSHTTYTSGQGFDVHQFEPGKEVILCGVKIPHHQKLKGHSDADVGLHAIVDGILGALALGDIGDHFPPSDPQWKDADSIMFLEHAVHLAQKNHSQIHHIDVTLICEVPKIGPFKKDMKQRIANVCNCSPQSVNIKATTTETLGFTGREEGIAAMANVTLRTYKNA